jgi:general stress protein YciG
MTGTKAGSQLAKSKVLARDPDYFKKIGALGGKALTGNKGFANMPREKVAEAGRLGGTRSKRPPHPTDCTCRSHKLRDWARGRQTHVEA